MSYVPEKYNDKQKAKYRPWTRMSRSQWPHFDTSLCLVLMHLCTNVMYV